MEDLPGAKGATLVDQRKIDRTMAKSCGSGVVGAAKCDLHTKASAERKVELREKQ